SVPLVLLIDDDWAAAPTWEARIRAGEDLIAQAESNGRGVALAPLSETGRDISIETPGAVRVRLRKLAPKPYVVDRIDAMPGIARLLASAPDAEVLWLSDGVDFGRGKEFIDALASALGRRTITVLDGGLTPAHALAAADNAARALSVKVLRAGAGPEDSGLVRALDLKSLPLGEAPYRIKSGDRDAEAQLTLPAEIRNDIARLELVSEHSAGAVQLLDKRWRR